MFAIQISTAKLPYLLVHILVIVSMVTLEQIVRQIGMNAGHHHVKTKEYVSIELPHITVVAQMDLLVNLKIFFFKFSFN